MKKVLGRLKNFRKISMYEFTAAQQKKALFWLVLFHIFIIAASNYLVLVPLSNFRYLYHLGRIFLSIYLPRYRPDRAHFRCTVGETDYFLGNVPGSAALLRLLRPLS